MASSPNGLNSARYCCAPRHGGAVGEVPVGGGARACTARWRRRPRRRARARRPPGRRRPRRRHRARASPARRRRGRASPRAARAATVRDTGAASPPGITVIVAVDLGVGDARDDDRLVGAAVGRRRALGAVPRRRQRVGRRGTAGIGRARRAARTALAGVDDVRSSERRSRRRRRATTSDEDRDALDLADASHPLPPERRPRRAPR